jgi:transcriptional regulator with PAS, ATPase and Fis domain
LLTAAIVALKTWAQRLAALDLSILLLGETGVGKELLARCIHGSGRTPDAPFIAVNCGALTRDLLAGELFG